MKREAGRGLGFVRMETLDTLCIQMYPLLFRLAMDIELRLHGFSCIAGKTRAFSSGIEIAALSDH
jgi:hypothetical protein